MHTLHSASDVQAGGFCSREPAVSNHLPKTTPPLWRASAHCQRLQSRSGIRRGGHAQEVIENESSTDERYKRRSLLFFPLASLPLFLPSPQPAAAEVAAVEGPTSMSLQPDTTITNKVALDISIAPRSFKTPNERTLGDKTVLPIDDAAPVGRLVLGLYGNTAPGTVGNFMRLIRSGALQQTTFSKVLPGEYIQAGQQASFRLGGVDADSSDLQECAIPHHHRARSSATIGWPKHSFRKGLGRARRCEHHFQGADIQA
ncbi:hypothetical protein DUNSADRAFT_3582 [Dunaliella salina]|uniref:PPIase cyclophilin-type domain-containing protein n=1 Tax=Dunaliella salina TaxID=3046 RepID=A0ABQ7GTQ7_DUNSA|nr:hypothetical protein DUNSADRAFT_3582 [Dunaliella salina]|eukprot:KAF5837989.1 hypothetical protein DUNSADRAFT_3582 [Dunaliella salina]